MFPVEHSTPTKEKAKENVPRGTFTRGKLFIGNFAPCFRNTM